MKPFEQIQICRHYKWKLEYSIPSTKTESGIFIALLELVSIISDMILINCLQFGLDTDILCSKMQFCPF